jgi:hypothetical protein
MEPEKNLHAKIAPALLAEAEKAAQAERITVDELVQDAVEHRLKERRRQKLYAYGEGQARKLGIKEEDVPRIVEEWRTEQQERENKERGR